MKLVKTRFYLQQLQNILRFIALNNPHAALSFDRSLTAKLNLISQQPYLCRASHYMHDESYRDLIHQGYTLIYKIETDRLVLLDIFKWGAR
ncbi:type II toxin-antitoxin system RelE/ParE family toxin [Thiomicrorhabdus cannonii]|uniref:type II toxin-antitoxin system RelE/ParE family toxin n=1 Tax=Thiomicrorhabdus cannonii TaxID=2748011 RepID=UPI0015BD7869|nr:type II toxin-antitoxin system RelE/ParE family toxin [Thiomicrorhabdus cannonii]